MSAPGRRRRSSAFSANGRKKPVRVLSDADWRTALALHQDHHWTFAQIAKLYGRTPRTVSERLRSLGARRHSSPARSTIKGRILHAIWMTMRQRCNNPSYSSFRHYGGRGIKISPKWERFESFHEWSLRTGYRVGLCLLLKDDKRDYSPENCRWGSAREMWRDRRKRLSPHSDAVRVRAFGEVKTLGEWARDPRCAVNRPSLYKRLRQGITPEAAIETPARRRGDEPLPKARKPVISKGTVREIDWDRAVRLRAQGAKPKEIAASLEVPYSTIAMGLLQRFGRTKRRHLPADRTRIYQYWESLRWRTTDRSHPLYPTNGAIGVRLCREWQDFETFYRWATKTGSKPGLCLVRVRHLGPFSPGNCRWLTRSEAFARRPQRAEGKKAVQR